MSGLVRVCANQQWHTGYPARDIDPAAVERITYHVARVDGEPRRVFAVWTRDAVTVIEPGGARERGELAAARPDIRVERTSATAVRNAIAARGGVVQ